MKYYILTQIVYLWLYLWYTKLYKIANKIFSTFLQVTQELNGFLSVIQNILNNIKCIKLYKNY